MRRMTKVMSLLLCLATMACIATSCDSFVKKANPPVATQEEWDSMVGEVGNLRNEVEQLKNEIQQMKYDQRVSEEDQRHKQIAQKEKRNEFCILNYVDGSGGGLQLRMTGNIGKESVVFFMDMNGGSLSFENDGKMWDASVKSVSDESGRMEVLLEDGAKGKLVGYLHGEMAGATYEGTFIDPSGAETPFSFEDDFMYWGL